MLLHEYDPNKDKFMLFNHITSDEYMMLLHTKTAKERKFVLELIEQKEYIRRTALLKGIEAPPVLDLALKEKYINIDRKSAMAVNIDITVRKKAKVV